MEVDSDVAVFYEEIQELKEKVSDILKDDHDDEWLLRWLKMTEYDQPKAELILRQCLNIRYTYQIDGICSEYSIPELIKKHNFSSFLGFDKSNAAIRHVSVGLSDFDGLMRCFSIFELALFAAYNIESDLKAKLENDLKAGRPRNDQILVIFNMEGFTLQQVAHKHVVDTGLDLIRIFQDLYTADILKRVIVINAPSYFSVVYNIVKPILRESIVEKLEVYPSEESVAPLLNHIDPDVLPKFLGGIRTDEDGDPMCSSFVPRGGKIPEKHYKQNATSLSLEEDGVIELIIPAGAYHDVIGVNPEPHSTIRIEMVSDNSIGVSIFYKKPLKVKDSSGNDSKNPNFEEEMISPYVTIQGHLCPVDAEVHCERVGEYIFRIDNTFSWMTAKRVLYRVKLTPSEDEKTALNNGNYEEVEKKSAQNNGNHEEVEKKSIQLDEDHREAVNLE